MIQDNIVTNLSDKELSLDEITILNKGFTFVPHNKKIVYSDLDDSVKRFERRLQLFKFFADKEDINDSDNSDENRLKFESNPTWWPKRLDANITEFCDKLKNCLYETINENQNKFTNISLRELKALRTLKRNKDIVIKKADKNSGIVVLNKIDYEVKIMEMLNDEKVYTKIDTSNDVEIKKVADGLLKDLLDNNYLTDKQYRYLTNYTPKTPTFYGIPKIHKKNNPLRPIVSQIDGPTYRLNQLIHELLYVAESEIPHLFKDTTAFLQYIESHKNVSATTILATMDVLSLYTNIAQNEAIEVVTDFYEETLEKWKNYSTSVLPVSPYFLRKMLSTMLSNCTFEFNGKLFSQNYGTPMGAPASVRIANIYMFKLLNKFFKNYNKSKPETLGRLIDDIFFVWQFSEADLLTLYHDMNTFHSTIKFELNYSHVEVNFLDTTVYIENEQIKTKLFIKPTDKKQYLHYTSCHPKHIMKAIPYSQALRYRRIITDEKILNSELEKLKHKFIIRKYPENTVNEQIEKVKTKPRCETLIYKTVLQKRAEFKKFTRNGPFLPFILTFRPEYNKLFELFQEYWKHFLANNETLADIFRCVTPQIVYKRGSTLANLLVRAKFVGNCTPTTTDVDIYTQDNVQILAELLADNNMVQKCNHPRCLLCRQITVTDSFKSYVTNKTFFIDTNMSCNVTKCIYVINCKVCHIQYVGQTDRKLKERINNHRSDIRLRKSTAVGIHFNTFLHNLDSFTVTPIEIVLDIEERKSKEQFWIKLLQTTYPKGLNNYPINKM